jgi:hypothetical protein
MQGIPLTKYCGSNFENSSTPAPPLVRHVSSLSVHSEFPVLVLEPPNNLEPVPAAIMTYVGTNYFFIREFIFQCTLENIAIHTIISYENPQILEKISVDCFYPPLSSLLPSNLKTLSSTEERNEIVTKELKTWNDRKKSSTLFM